MKKESRQTLIGIVGLTVVQLAALSEGYNGNVLVAYMASVVALIAPEALDRLPFN